MDYANTLVGADAYCFKAFAEAMEVIPYTLAENAGLNPIATVTELRNRYYPLFQFDFEKLKMVSNVYEAYQCHG